MMNRLRSFLHAFRGAATLVRGEPNARIHLVATVLVGIAGIAFHLRAHEWALLVIGFALVWCTEAINTAIESLADEVTEERRERIRRAKDVAAFAVLVAAIAAVILGAIAFWPHLFR